MSDNLQIPTYKGKPMVRKDNKLYYGNPEDPYIIILSLNDFKSVKDLSIATNVEIELQVNDPTLSEKARLIKKAKREGLYKALDVAQIWLDDALSMAQ